ncbi:epithelial cell-transforming sequence 2 oncogene-like [Littorina saxatilis]|uniref:epithelial cell-transforming sequence 2 oncogene-like n=1 Tax=Littorina saxatilis TaxID=31220 RepID=UPI0038B48832
MAALTNGGTNGKKKTMMMQTRLSITEDDSKILGRTTNLRREKTATTDQVKTLKLKTHNSAWTPMVHKPSNQQIFKERRDLVSHWFDLWSDSQRKRFFDVVFRQCTRSQYKFVQDWFRELVPMQHLDFSTVLPRFLSLYIFSFLDPKSLCRCAQVSWTWKFLLEQDDVWMPKCLRLGWFLPYTPADNEYGAWKRHYVACIHTLDSMAGSKRAKPLPPGYPDNMHQPQMTLKSARLSRMDSRKLMDTRPPWYAPNHNPKDLEQSTRALAHGASANEPVRAKTDTMMFNKWGILKSQHESAITARSLDFEIGVDSKQRRAQHRVLLAGADQNLPRAGRDTLGESVRLQSNLERRMEQLVNTNWMPPTSSVMKRVPKARQQMNVIQPGGNITHSNPRIVIVSSRVPGADLLLDAVLFGVIPIVYEYEGTASASLVEQVEAVLQGRHAQSVGLFCHADEPGQLCLAHGCSVTLDTIDHEEVSTFFEAVANHILPADMGGQFDIFVPLAASEDGMEMLVELSVKTSMQFSSPTGIIGNYNHVNSAWLLDYDKKSPPEVYFCTSKLQVWANVADQAQEAMQRTHEQLAPFFEKTHRDIVSQLTGQVIFDVLKQTDIQGVHDITQVLTEGLKSLGDQKDVINPVEFLGRFLLQKSSSGEQNGMISRQPTLTSVTEHDEEQDSLQASRSSMSSRRQASRERSREEEEEEVGEEEHDPEEEEGEGNMRASAEEEGELSKYAGEEKATKEERNQRRRQFKTTTLKTQELSSKFGTMRATKTQRLTPGQYTDHPEKRTPIAFEIQASEQEYMRTLQAIRDVYLKPLKSALASNRAVIGGQDIQVIFTDIMNIFKLSRELAEDVQNRLEDWDPQHTCLGDIFVKFCAKMRVYTNFTNNYEVILRSIERCKQQSPTFRAFLERHERVPETKMLTLQEMLLLAVRRIGEYVNLLNWFEFHTPRTHADRQDLCSAIATLTELNSGMKECRTRMERERELVQLTRRIISCPALLEANRYLVKRLDVAHLRPPQADAVAMELRVFQRIATLGLYLFNDALVITKRTSKHFPFSRAVEYTYRFESSVSLSSLQVLDMPDSKFAKNAFRMTTRTNKREWVCSAETPHEKFNWVALLEQCIRGAIRK